MKYYINPILFYIINVSTEIKILLYILGGIVLISSAFFFVSWITESVDITDLEDDEKKILKLYKKIIIASLITLFIGVLVPSKEACIEMMIASQVTHENVTATKEEIYEIIDYVTVKMNGKEE